MFAQYFEYYAITGILMGGVFCGHTVDTFSGAFAPDGILPGAKVVQVLRSSVLSALLHSTQQRNSAKLCVVVQGMELWNF